MAIWKTLQIFEVRFIYIVRINLHNELHTIHVANNLR